MSEPLDRQLNDKLYRLKLKQQRTQDMQTFMDLEREINDVQKQLDALRFAEHQALIYTQPKYPAYSVTIKRDLPQMIKPANPVEFEITLDPNKLTDSHFYMAINNRAGEHSIANGAITIKVKK